MDQGAQGCGANTIQAPAKIATPTTPGPDEPMRLPAKPYQNDIASVVQTMAERKNSFGRGKNETNIVCIQSQVRRFPVPLSDSAHAGSARSKGGLSEACPPLPVVSRV